MIQGDRRFEYSVEAKVDKLLAYQLSFQELADAVRRFSIDLPAGVIDSDSGTFVVRTRGQAYSEEEFAKIPIRSASGADVLLGEVAQVRDGFEEGNKRVEFNGKPAMFVQVMRTGNESAIDISNKVHAYVGGARGRFPAGVHLFVWSDESIAIRARLSTLAWSMLQGRILVLLVLGLFLRPMLAFWIVVGIPVSFAGAVMLMPSLGVTANVMSLFGYILVLGIVVDDAIVTGENVFAKLRAGMAPLEAAVKGAQEVAVPVTFGCLTTVIAFIPMLFFEGTWGDFAKQIPPVAAPVILFSLLESKLCLPSHLKHLRVSDGQGLLARLQGRIARGLERFVAHVYQPTLRATFRHRATVLAGFLAVGLVMAGYCVGGRMKFISFPSVDTGRITALLDLPDNTPLETTAKYMDRIAAALERVEREFVDPGTGESLIRNAARVVGARSPGHPFEKSTGYMSLEVLDPDRRSAPGPRNSEIANRWNDLIGPIPEATSFRIASEESLQPGREYADDNLHLELRGPSSPRKAQVAEKIKSILADYRGVANAWAQVNYGQDELEFHLKPRAAELGLTQALLAQQVRQAFYGEEAQRVQRGVDDIRVMVRLPKAARETLHTLDRLKIRTPRGADAPLATVADLKFTKAPSFVERNDGAEIIRIGAQPMDETVDLIGIAREITPRIEAMCRDALDLSFEYKGSVAEAAESKRQTIVGAGALMLALYAMLAIPLQSLLQPVFVMVAIPFAIIGALLGHMVMDITPCYLSIFGMLALAGVAVNDSLVLVDFVNERRREGATLQQAAFEAGGRRFRPIVLTSATTFAGLVPLMLDRSTHSQFLVPMAVSLGLGILFATGVTLYLVPCSLLVADDIGRALAKLRDWHLRPFQTSAAELRTESIHGTD